MLIGTAVAEPMARGAIVVAVEAVETRIVEFHMSCRRILRDQGVFHKHHNTQQGLESDKVKLFAWQPAELVLSSTPRLQLRWRLRLVA